MKAGFSISNDNKHCRRWRSYTSPQETHLAHSVTEAIDLLFQKVEERHGYLLVAHCLAYITAAKHGLSESEMEDVVSLDDEVIKIETTTLIQCDSGSGRLVPVSSSSGSSDPSSPLDSS